MSRLLIALLTLVVTASRADEIDAARQRWAESPHGPMLERILPPTFDRRHLPEPRSKGAQLALRYCIQCHNLPNPARHDAKRWPSVIDRMVARMRGKGNFGALMTEMMAKVGAPTVSEQQVLLAYFTRHAQKPLDETKIPEVLRPSGESFRLACSQCHVLPDPKRYTAAQWPAVVARMRKNMEWMNRIVGSKPDPTEPQLRIEEINAFLARYARR